MEEHTILKPVSDPQKLFLNRQSDVYAHEFEGHTQLITTFILYDNAEFVGERDKTVSLFTASYDATIRVYDCKVCRTTTQ